MNTPTDKEVRDWYMGYGVEGRAELADVEGDAFDRYLLERDARVAKETEERIIKLLEEMAKSTFPGDVWHINPFDYAIALIKGDNK